MIGVPILVYGFNEAGNRLRITRKGLRERRDIVNQYWTLAFCPPNFDALQTEEFDDDGQTILTYDFVVRVI